MPVKQRKICVMGSRSVGKSSLTIQFIDGQFVDSYDPTIENIFEKPVKFNGQDYLVKVVDTAGQDEFSIFASGHAMDTHGYMIVYDLNNSKSLKVAKAVYLKLLDQSGHLSPPILLVGNKTDLTQERTVEQNEIEAAAEDMNVAHFEVTAKSKREVDNVFNTMLSIIEKQGTKVIGDEAQAADSASSSDASRSQRGDKKCVIN